VFKEMTLRTAWWLFRGSLIVLAFQTMMVCSCGFAPGWADLPGLSKHTVFAGWMTGMLLLAQIAAATGLLAPLCAGLNRAVRKDYIAWSSFLILMVVALLAALYVCSRTYPVFRASIAEEWK